MSPPTSRDSAGVGRTGTYIAIDVILQHIQDHPSVCVQGVLQDLRNQRMKMVQSEVGTPHPLVVYMVTPPP
jgi:protein tyrosine phosphatase